MPRTYPNIEDIVKAKMGLCSQCKKPSEKRFKVEVQVSYFRGDDEISHLCLNCLQLLQKRIERQNHARWDARAKAEKKEEICMRNLFSRIQRKFKVRKLTEYQWRVEEGVDIYPVNRRYHILKTNKRGDYRDAFRFLDKHFAPESIELVKGKAKIKVLKSHVDKKTGVTVVSDAILESLSL